MKRLIFLIAFLMTAGFPPSLFASTEVPPSITTDTDWNQGGNPYIIKGKVTIPRGSSLTINTGVQVIFQGAAVLEVNGLLEVNGTAAGPAVFNMIEGGLQSEIAINGGTAHLTNAKILSGVFLAKDAKLTMEGSEITKGSGVYLQGSTTARMKNNKIYGNATGVVLDGQVVANLSFNTIVQNTYGLMFKNFSDIAFKNNSIHDNQKEVVNNTPSLKLPGNYWGTDDSNAVQAKIEGSVDLNPVKNLKDILRVYVRTQLPVITAKMSKDLAARERRQEKEDAIALKKLKKAEVLAAKKKAAAPEVGAPEVASPVVEAPPAPETPAEKAAPEAPAVAEAPAAPEAPAETVPTSPSKVISVKSLAPAPHTLKPIAGLPPAQDFGKPEDASTLSAVGETQASTVPPPPATAAAPPSTDMAIPSVPDATMAPPPAPAAVGDTNTVPAPPDLGEQMPPSTSAPPVVPPPPGTGMDNTPAAAAPPPPANVEPTADQTKAVKKLDAIGGDIDGMQPPPLDLGPDLSNKDLDAIKPPPGASDLGLPPLKDTDVKAPKDLDLPPIDDLGNINLDSRNK